MEVKEVKNVKAPYTFMFERMRDTAVALDETICRVGDRLIDKYNLVPEDLIDFGSTHPEPGVGIGRVQCDSDGRLNSNSVILHGSLDSSSGVSIPVDLSQVANFSLFPGQVSNKVSRGGCKPSLIVVGGGHGLQQPHRDQVGGQQGL